MKGVFGIPADDRSYAFGYDERFGCVSPNAADACVANSSANDRFNEFPTRLELVSPNARYSVGESALQGF